MTFITEPPTWADYRRYMSGKILEEYPSRRRNTWNAPQPKILTCSFCCCFSTTIRAEMDRHVNAVHTLRLVSAYDKTKVSS